MKNLMILFSVMWLSVSCSFSQEHKNQPTENINQTDRKGGQKQGYWEETEDKIKASGYTPTVKKRAHGSPIIHQGLFNLWNHIKMEKKMGLY